MSEVRYLWIDFESDDVDPKNGRIIEAGVIATSDDLDDEIFTINAMIKDGDVANTVRNIEGKPALVDMHGSNGLLADLKKVRDGEMAAITLQDLDRELYDLIVTNNHDAHKIILSGSGVGHYDHNVIKERMPLLDSLLIFYPRDIGQTRREFKSAVGYDLVPINSTKTHRAFQDVTDHKNETKAFRDFFRRAVLALGILGMED